MNFGFTALSIGQLNKLLAHVTTAEIAGKTVIGLVVNNPAGRTLDVSLIDQDGMPFDSVSFGIDADDLALTHPDVIANDTLVA